MQSGSMDWFVVKNTWLTLYLHTALRHREDDLQLYAYLRRHVFRQVLEPGVFDGRGCFIEGVYGSLNVCKSLRVLAFLG